MITINLIKGNISVYNNDYKIDTKKLVCNIDIECELEKIVEKLESDSSNNIQRAYVFNDIEMYSFYRSTLCNQIKDFLKIFFVLESILKIYIDDKVVVKTDDVKVKRSLENIFEIECFLINSNLKEKVTNKGKGLKLRVIKGFGKLIKNILNRKPKILALTQVASINKITIGDKEFYYDTQYGKLLSQLSKDNKIIELQQLNSINMINNANLIDNNFVPMETFKIMKKVMGKLFKKKEFSIVNNIEALKDIKITIGERDITESFYTVYLRQLGDVYLNYAIEIKAAEFMIKAMKICKVIAINEADRPRCFITAGNINDIPTFGIQHGIISKVSYAYFTPTTQSILIPKITFLWGKDFQDLLISNSNVYNQNNTIIVGQNRTDYLIDKLVSQKKENNNKTKILYATQPIDDLTYEATRVLFESIQGDVNKEVLIKLHPNDKNDKYYIDMVKEYNLNNVIIAKDIDLYDAIIWCDLIYTVHSTVVLEGAILNKPSICCLLQNYYDQGNFVKNKISMGVNNSYELKLVLEQKKMLANKNVLENNIFSPDGKVYLRMIQHIMNI